MKKLLLISILLFVVFTKTFAQDCKWEENKKDPITDTKYVKSKKTGSIKGEKPSPGVLPVFKSYIELKDSKVSVFILFGIQSILSLEKIQNPEIIIKLADGTKIDIHSNEQFATNIQAQINYTTADLKWIIATDDMKKLTASNITAIRISFAGQDYSFTIDDKQAKEFQTMFSCMSKEL